MLQRHPVRSGHLSRPTERKSRFLQRLRALRESCSSSNVGTSVGPGSCMNCICRRALSAVPTIAMESSPRRSKQCVNREQVLAEKPANPGALDDRRCLK